MEEKMFPVFSVDICFDSYAMDQIFVGAEDKKDLIKSLGTLIDKNDAKKVAKDGWRIKKVPNLYTDKPYSILDRYGYIE